MPDKLIERGEIELPVKTNLSDVEKVLNALSKDVKETSGSLVIQQKLIQRIIDFKTGESRLAKRIVTDLRSQDEIIAGLQKRYRLNYEQAEKIRQVLSAQSVTTERTAGFWDRLHLRSVRWNESIQRAREGSRAIVTDTGEVVRRQTLQDKLLGNLVGGFKELIGTLLPVSIFFGGFIMALVKIVDYFMKTNAEGVRFRSIMGDINGALAETWKTGGDISFLMGTVSTYLRINHEEASELVSNFVSAGGSMKVLGDTLESVTQRAVFFRTTSEATGVQLKDLTSMSQRLRFTMVDMSEKYAMNLEFSGGNMQTQVYSADLLTSYMARIAGEARDLGLSSEDVFATMSDLVKEADRLNIDYMTSVNVYSALLKLKREDVRTMGGLTHLSEEAIKDFATLVVKASDLSLQTKAFIAAFSGRPITSLVDLERTFIRGGDFAEMLAEATRKPVNLIVGLFRGEQQQKMLDLLQKNTEEGTATRRVIYDVYRNLYEQLGISFEMFEAMVTDQRFTQRLHDAMQKANEVVKQQQDTLIEGAQETAQVGQYIIAMSGGIRGVQNLIVGYLEKMLGWLRIIATRLGYKEEKPLTVYQKLELPETRKALTEMYKRTGKEIGEAELMATQLAGQLRFRLSALQFAQTPSQIKGAVSRLQEVLQPFGFKISIDAGIDKDKVIVEVDRILTEIQTKYGHEKATQQQQRAAAVTLPGGAPLIPGIR